jgi:hypothetical protein
MMSLVLVGALILLEILIIAARKCHSYFGFSAIWSHVKTPVLSFLAVCATADTQFGVLWPESFAKTLDALSTMSLDLGILLSASCVVQTALPNELRRGFDLI